MYSINIFVYWTNINNKYRCEFIIYPLKTPLNPTMPSLLFWLFFIRGEASRSLTYYKNFSQWSVFNIHKNKSYKLGITSIRFIEPWEFKQLTHWSSGKYINYNILTELSRGLRTQQGVAARRGASRSGLTLFATLALSRGPSSTWRLIDIWTVKCLQYRHLYPSLILPAINNWPLWVLQTWNCKLGVPLASVKTLSRDWF